MSGSILTAKHGEDLNQLVQKLIDPRLFLLCNYEPTIGHAISEDGRYLLNIQDLYKFAIDSCPVIKRYYDFVSGVWPDSRKWESLQGKIQAFRTVFAHNTSEKDGLLSAETMDAYMIWVRAAIGKLEPETLDDYGLLNKKLSEMAEELRCCFESFIRCVAQQPDRRKVVDTWIQNTLYWYTHNTKVDIYKGCLIQTYTAKAAEAHMDISHPSFNQYRAQNVREWIACLKIFHIEERIRELEKGIAAKEDLIAGKKLLAPLPPAIIAKCRLEVEGMKKERSTQQRELDSMQDKKVKKDTEQKFYSNLQNQLLQTKDYLDKEGIEYTLLPQDFLQEDIKRVFCKVPIPGKKGNAR